jgi:hypothetical protein
MLHEKHIRTQDLVRLVLKAQAETTNKIRSGNGLGEEKNETKKKVHQCPWSSRCNNACGRGVPQDISCPCAILLAGCRRLGWRATSHEALATQMFIDKNKDGDMKHKLN